MKIPNAILCLALGMAICHQGFSSERLINGTPADIKLWPASVYARMSSSRCSATVVGERTLLIAAHCVGTGQKAGFTVGANSYSSVCTRSSLYGGNSTADWALCLIDKSVTGVPYEKINTNPALFEISDVLTLTGYGCTKPGGGGGNDGIYRIGKSTIKKLPSGNNHDIVTSGNAALCFGDSGGPAFFVDESSGERWLVGVNSRGDISKTSYLSSVSTEAAQAFIKSWAEKNGQKICGIHEDAQNCRVSPGL